MKHCELRQELTSLCHSLFQRGLTGGTSGNISCATDDGCVLITPTGSSCGTVRPEDMALLAADGTWIEGGKPSKEYPLHLHFYAEHTKSGAVVHLHSAHSVAVSCLRNLTASDVFPPLTPYYVMQIGHTVLVPYHKPGSAALFDAVRTAAQCSNALLLAHHGPVVWGKNLQQAAAIMEELEATARLFLLLQGQDYTCLSPQACQELYSQ